MGDFEISGAAELRALAGQLAAVPQGMRSRLRTRMRAAATPMKNAVQRNALAIPVHGGKSTGLRRAIAAATKIRTTVTSTAVTVRVEVDSGSMPPGQEKLPALMESRGWTHEVFGHQTKVFQPGHGYFIAAVNPLMPAMRAAVEQVADDAVRQIR